MHDDDDKESSLLSTEDDGGSSQAEETDNIDKHEDFEDTIEAYVEGCLLSCQNNLKPNSLKSFR